MNNKKDDGIHQSPDIEKYEQLIQFPHLKIIHILPIHFNEKIVKSAVHKLTFKN